MEDLEEPDGKENEEREKRENGKKVLPASQKEEERRPLLERDKYKDFLWKLKDLFNPIPE